MTSDTEEADDGHVIFSLLVNSERPIEALAAFAAERRHPRPDHDHLSEIDHASFAEPSWSPRAARVDAVLREALDRLDSTGVDPDELDDPGVVVRAFFTFPRGAETISAEAIQRLARFHATLWIDTLD